MCKCSKPTTAMATGIPGAGQMSDAYSHATKAFGFQPETEGARGAELQLLGSLLDSASASGTQNQVVRTRRAATIRARYALGSTRATAAEAKLLRQVAQVCEADGAVLAAATKEGIQNEGNLEAWRSYKERLAEMLVDMKQGLLPCSSSLPGSNSTKQAESVRHADKPASALAELPKLPKLPDQYSTSMTSALDKLSEAIASAGRLELEASSEQDLLARVLARQDMLREAVLR